jgi:rhodanese-related sulfurtransferase
MVTAILLSMGISGTTCAEELQGKVKAVSRHSRTMAVAVEKQGVVVFKFDGATQFRNAVSATDIIQDEVVTVAFTKAGAENLAKIITKVIAPLPDGVTRISAGDLLELIRKGGDHFLLIDSRPAGKYNEGHLPKAVSIPYHELEKAAEKILPADREKTLIFYCGGLSCVLSPKSAAIAVKLGFMDIRMYPEGEPGWRKLEYPTEPSTSFVKSGNIVLIDLRSTEKVNAGHIPRAVNIPASRLEASEKGFPEFKGVPLVFYSDREEEMNLALELMRDWGYSNATVFPGGLKAWQSAGYQPATGPAATQISYVRKLAEGELAIKDFETIIKDGSHLVVDARTAEEFGKGHIPGAINIPAEEMAARNGEVSAGKPVVVYCSTGTRAEMAYDILKEKGIKVRYLRASIEFGPGNKTVIKE